MQRRAGALVAFTAALICTYPPAASAADRQVAAWTESHAFSESDPDDDPDEPPMTGTESTSTVITTDGVSLKIVRTMSYVTDTPQGPSTNTTVYNCSAPVAKIDDVVFYPESHILAPSVQIRTGTSKVIRCLPVLISEYSDTLGMGFDRGDGANAEAVRSALLALIGKK